MFGKVKQVGEVIKAQRKMAELKKQLEKIQITIEEGNIKMIVKATVGFSEISSLEYNGEEITGLPKAIKKANKEIAKQIQKKYKSGEISDMGMF